MIYRQLEQQQGDRIKGVLKNTASLPMFFKSFHETKEVEREVKILKGRYCMSSFYLEFSQRQQKSTSTQTLVDKKYDFGFSQSISDVSTPNSASQQVLLLQKSLMKRKYFQVTYAQSKALD